MTARYLIGDVLEVLPTLEDNSVDLILTSPPFLALRSYLPADHPDKAKEGGSQPTPGAFIDWLVDVVEALDRVLAPHGSMVIELGDTYAGGGGGPDSSDLVDKGHQHSVMNRMTKLMRSNREAWPADKSLTLIPELFRMTLVYGFNPLTGRQTKRWRLRNVIRWVRPNPPPGALGDKFRPATSELMVFCRTDEAGRRRFFDLDAVRTEPDPRYAQRRFTPSPIGVRNPDGSATVAEQASYDDSQTRSNPAGAPPLDWWKMDSAPCGSFGCGLPRGHNMGQADIPSHHAPPDSAPPLDWWNIPPGGYQGAHYAVWPPELLVKPIKAMTPERVCRTCGEPSRRIVEKTPSYAEFRLAAKTMRKDPGMEGAGKGQGGLAGSGYNRDPHGVALGSPSAIHRSGEKYRTVDWSDCSHDDYRPGLVLDPFAGSGTTLAVAVGHGRDAVGIDLDERNARLAEERIGFFLEVVQ